MRLNRGMCKIMRDNIKAHKHFTINRIITLNVPFGMMVSQKLLVILKFQSIECKHNTRREYLPILTIPPLI